MADHLLRYESRYIQSVPKVTNGFQNLITFIFLTLIHNTRVLCRVDIGNKFTLVEKDYIFEAVSIFSLARMGPFEGIFHHSRQRFRLLCWDVRLNVVLQLLESLRLSGINLSFGIAIAEKVGAFQIWGMWWPVYTATVRNYSLRQNLPRCWIVAIVI